MLTTTESKIKIQELKHLSSLTDEGTELIKGLSQTPKTIPPKYFYDQLGSQLFEQICDLPEYYPTRTEASILKNSVAEIAEITGVCEIVELGSGSSTKTRLLLSAYEKLGKPWQYVPIDVSSEILQISANQLHQEYQQLSVLGLVGTYQEALTQLPPCDLPHRLIIFLGSSLGNFTQTQSDRLFTQVQNVLNVGDYFLLGIDLQKPAKILESAYNDAQGITSQFNLNMLSHLNRRFQGNFNPSQFHHQAIYNQQAQQIEMYLESQAPQHIKLNGLNFDFKLQKNEKILTEISRKFNLPEMEQFLAQHRLKTIKSWTDENNWFGLILAQLT